MKFIFKKYFSIVVMAFLCCLATASYAHHSFAAQFDPDQPVELIGTVTKIEWTNPHARFYVDVEDESGNVVNWNLELASPNMMVRNGWTRNFVVEGDEVTVMGMLSRDGSKMANALRVLLSDGTMVMGNRE
jgi:hypothetical protein